MKIQRIMYNAETSLSYFSSHVFKIDNFNFNDLNLAIPKLEKKDFFVNETFYATSELFKQTYINALSEIFHEKPEDLPKAKQRYFYIKLVSNAVRIMFYYFVYRVVNRIALNLLK